MFYCGNCGGSIPNASVSTCPHCGARLKGVGTGDEASRQTLQRQHQDHIDWSYKRARAIENADKRWSNLVKRWRYTKELVLFEKYLSVFASRYPDCMAENQYLVKKICATLANKHPPSRKQEGAFLSGMDMPAPPTALDINRCARYLKQLNTKKDDLTELRDLDLGALTQLTKERSLDEMLNSPIGTQNDKEYAALLMLWKNIDPLAKFPPDRVQTICSLGWSAVIAMSLIGLILFPYGDVQVFFGFGMFGVFLLGGFLILLYYAAHCWSRVSWFIRRNTL
jgi:hypothetical protein